MLSASTHSNLMNKLNSKTEDIQIQSCSFSVIPCNNKKMDPQKFGAYKVLINFFSDAEKNILISQKKLVMLQVKQCDPEKSVYDVYSMNGIATSDEKKLLSDKNVRKQDVVEAKRITDVVHELQLNDNDIQTLFVLDLKDFPNDITKSQYDNKKGCITNGEQKFVNFIKSGSKKSAENANALRDQLLNLHVNYVIMEGNIKANLISSKFFSKEEKDFLQTKGDGSQAFCQLVEFFMNAFKRGQDVVVKEENDKIHFNADSYIKKILDNTSDYVPVTKCVTFYPSFYREMAVNGSYTKAVRNAPMFDVETKVHETSQVTEMHTTMRQS